jgi:hypothetical protein
MREKERKKREKKEKIGGGFDGICYSQLENPLRTDSGWPSYVISTGRINPYRTHP